MEEEMHALEENETWDLVDAPKGVKLIGCRWVYKLKYNTTNFVNRYKARLVAKGYQLRWDICDSHEDDDHSCLASGDHDKMMASEHIWDILTLNFLICIFTICTIWALVSFTSLVDRFGIKQTLFIAFLYMWAYYSNLPPIYSIFSCPNHYYTLCEGILFNELHHMLGVWTYGEFCF